MVLETFRLTNDFTWDRANGIVFDDVIVNQGDANGRKMRVQVINRGVVENLTGSALNLAWQAANGHGLDHFTAVNAAQGIFEIAFRTGMLSNVGRINASLQLVLPGQGGIVESRPFVISNQKSVVAKNAIESSNSFTALDEALSKVGDMATVKDLQQLSLAFKESYPTLSALQAAYPNGNVHNHAVLTDNMIYTYKNGWISTGIQANGTGLADGTVTPTKTNFLEVGGFSTQTKDLYPSITLSPQGDFYMVENGKMANTDATQTYKNTGQIIVDKKATYQTRGVNHWLFYNTSNVYLGYWAFNANGATDATALQDLPIPETASYMIGNVNNLYWRVDPLAVPQLLESKQTEDGVVFKKLIVTPDNFNDEVSEMINNAQNGLAKDYKGAVIVNFGDSIIETKNPSVSDLLADYTGAKTINVGFGGCMMSPHPNADFAKFSMSNLVDAIVSNNFSAQEDALAGTGIPASFRATLDRLKAINWSTVKAITISYGTNDWVNSNKIDNPADKYDKSYYLGALRYSVRAMLQKAKHLQIVVSPPIFRSTNDRSENANNWKNGNGEYLKDYANAVTNVGKELKILVADTFYGLGINEFNESEYFPSTDGTHPNAKGRALIAAKLAETLVYGASANPNVAEIEKRVKEVDTRELANFNDHDARLSSLEDERLIIKNQVPNNFKNAQFYNLVGQIQGEFEFSVSELSSNARIGTNETTFLKDHKYYVSTDILAKYKRLTFYSFRGFGVTEMVDELIVPNQWSRVSLVSSPSSTGEGSLFLYHGTDAYYQVGDTIKLRNPRVINLTEVFGNDTPSNLEMNQLIDMLDGWFEGEITVNEKVQVRWMLKKLREKANKKQESWIPAVLINGATGELFYRKNELGRVEFKGTVQSTSGSSVTLLPVGYRPDRITQVLGIAESGAGYKYISIHPTGPVYLGVPYNVTGLINMTSISIPTD